MRRYPDSSIGRPRRRAGFLLAILAVVLMPLGAAAQLNITVSGGLGDLDGDGTGAGEAAVLQAVLNCWSSRVLTNRNFTLTVATANLSGGTIGQGAVSASDGSGIPTAGRITMDSPRTYFIDPTPLDNSEFPTPDPNSQWRLIGGTGTDLYSVVEHEVGHAMAWVCATALDNDGDGTQDCGFPNPNYDGLMNPAPGSFVSDPTCRSPFPTATQGQTANCVRLQAGGTVPLNVPLRGDGRGGSGSSVVNELSHPGVSGDLMLGFYTGGTREMQSVDDVNVFNYAYGDTVNLPLTVNAGMDIVAECDAPGGATVMLDGSGSTDPEGNTLTYAWSCPAVTLAGAGSAQPSGFFPLDVTVTCRLDATDVAACPPDADTVDVIVTDTTAPVIVCPEDITVECTGNCGIEADDPQLAGFFASVTASDVCDPTVTLSNDAPAFFNLGDTVVTFTAQDDSLNTNSCQATVTVQDTTDPEVEMELDRDTLWPPNHKMVTINATVTVEDICDPNAGFVLTSVTSNEPDEGLGDGDFPDDIQGNDTGTDDLSFDLRAERSGTGEGRVYTVTYTGSDKSNNAVSVSATVTVPHDRQGLGKPTEGFTADGTDIAPSARRIGMAVYSTASFDATQIARTATQLGNTRRVIDPREMRTADLDCDGLLDVEVYFPAESTRRLHELTLEDEPVALRYETLDGQGYLVPDIFGLGAPASPRPCAGSSGTVPDLEMEAQ